MRPPTAVLALLLATVLAAGCLGSAGKPTSNSTANDSAADMGNMTMAQAFTVTVGGGVCPPNAPTAPTIYTLSPAKLTLKLNEPVNLTLKNAGCDNHDLVIEGIDGAKVPSTGAGKSTSVTFTPTKAGSYKMYCTIGGGTPLAHKDNGMQGDVTVA